MRMTPPLLVAPTVEPHSLVVYSKIKHALFFLLLFSEINEMLNNIFIKHILGLIEYFFNLILLKIALM